MTRQLARLGCDIAAPIIVYYVLRSAGASYLIALSAGAVPPALSALYALITRGVWFITSVRTERPAAFIFARPFMEGMKWFASTPWEVLWETEPGSGRSGAYRA